MAKAKVEMTTSTRRCICLGCVVRRSLAGALVLGGLPAAVTWSVLGCGLPVVALTCSLMWSRFRGRRLPRWFGFLAGSAYLGAVLCLPVFAAVLGVMPNSSASMPTTVLVASSALYLLAVPLAPRLVRRTR